jgi:NTP pyrophosphatase (non-canonical NTP hydrolase)
MDFKEYSEKAKRTLSHIPDDMQNLHLLLGMVTEIGELADNFKKSIAYGKDIDWVNVKEELGDYLWYFVNFCTLNNINIEGLLDINIKKLEARYPEKFFTKERANTRDLERERKVLEELGYGDKK